MKPGTELPPNHEENSMKKFAWVYLLISLMGAVTTMVVSIPLKPHSIMFKPVWNIFAAVYTIFSPLASISSIMALILACLNRLQPRRVFLTLSLCYLGLWAFGVGLFAYHDLFHSIPGYTLFARFRLPPLQFLVKKSSWAGYVYWPWMIAWLILSIRGIYAYLASQMDTGDKVPGFMVKIPWPVTQVLTFLASLLMALQAVFLTPLLFPVLGVRPLGFLLFFPFTVAFYILVNLLLIILRRREEAGGPAAGPLQVSWLVPASLILPGADFFLFIFFRNPLIHLGAFYPPLFSMAGIVVAVIALWQHRKGPGLRGMGMVAVGLIWGCLFLMISISEFSVYGPIIQKVEWGYDSKPDAAKKAEVLVEACRKGDRGSVEALIAKGADINARGRAGFTPLAAASRKGHREVVEMLLANGADINAQTHHGETALMAASSRGRRETVEMLLAKGAEVNARDESGRTALMEASGRGRREIVELLLAKGAEVNAKSTAIGDTALIKASFRGHREIVLLLLAQGAEINARQKDGQTALAEACFMGRREVVQALLDKGADVNAKTRFGATALWSAAFRGDLEMVQALLDKGAGVNAQSDEGGTALGAAASRGNLKIVQVLLAKGADINVRNKNGGTALTAACREGHLEIVQLLLAHGADDYSKNRALKIPSKNNQRQIRGLLIKAGAK